MQKIESLNNLSKEQIKWIKEQFPNHKYAHEMSPNWGLWMAKDDDGKIYSYAFSEYHPRDPLLTYEKYEPVGDGVIIQDEEDVAIVLYLNNRYYVLEWVRY